MEFAILKCLSDTIQGQCAVSRTQKLSHCKEMQEAFEERSLQKCRTSRLRVPLLPSAPERFFLSVFPSSEDAPPANQLAIQH